METATTSTPGAAPSSATAERMVDSRSPRFEPSPTYARGTAASLATLARLVGRRFLAVCLLALCICGTATAASVRSMTDPFEPQEWWLSDVGADPAAAPGPGVPITIVDSGTDPTHPDFAGRPNTTFLNSQTTFGARGVPRDDGRFARGRTGERRRPRRRLSDRGAAALRREPEWADPRSIAAIQGIEAAAAHCPGVINLSFGGVVADPQMHDAILEAVHNGCLVVAAAGNFGLEGNPPTYPASWPHVFTVAATDQNDSVSSFSSISPRPTWRRRARTWSETCR